MIEKCNVCNGTGLCTTDFIDDESSCSICNGTGRLKYTISGREGKIVHINGYDYLIIKVNEEYEILKDVFMYGTYVYWDTIKANSLMDVENYIRNEL